MDLLQQYAKFLANGGLIPYAAKGLDYLRRAILGDAPSTSSVGVPFTPPFSGGQCSGGDYTIGVTYTYIPTGAVTNYTTGVSGAIKGIERRFNSSAGEDYWYLVTNNGATVGVVGGSVSLFSNVSITSVHRNDGADSCGDLPNPNPAPSIAVDGLASSAAPDLLDGAEYIIEGTPLEPDGSSDLLDGTKNDFTDAGALAPTDIAGAIGKIAAGLYKLTEILALLNDLLDLLKKLFNKENKSSFSFNLGSLRYDGFVRLFSEPPNPNITGLYLDLQVTSVKEGASKLFGQKSPNYFNREPIGYVHFVSTTFGVLETHEIRFVRTSIPIPPLAYGFFYNMGLDGVNKANATGFYLKEEQSSD